MLSEPSFIVKKIVMIHTNQGQKISFLNDNLIVKDKEGKNSITIHMSQNIYYIYNRRIFNNHRIN